MYIFVEKVSKSTKKCGMNGKKKRRKKRRRRRR
jgi:hypothetical protein